jgi:hypothetical protein
MYASLPEIAANVIAVLFRQHHIEDYQVVRALHRAFESGLAIRSRFDLEALAPQPIGKRYDQAFLVLD